MSSRSISHVQGKGSLTHNNRVFQPKNADPDRKKDNVVLKKQSIDDAYKEIFGNAVADYNAKQKRKDRRIDDYFESLFNRPPANHVLTGTNKQKSFYEDLIQLGDVSDTPVGSSEGDLAKICLIEYYHSFCERNANFRVFNAVVHMDEATPHLHLDYIPVGHYKRGMTLQNGLAQALKEMGFGTGKDAISRWRESERKVFAEICRSHGFEIAEEKPGRGHSYTVDEYKDLQDRKNELLEEIVTLEESLAVAEEAVLSVHELEDINSSVKSKTSLRGSESVLIDRKDYDRLYQQAKFGATADIQIRKLNQETKSMHSTIDKLNSLISHHVNSIKSLKSKVKDLTNEIFNFNFYRSAFDEFLRKFQLEQEWFEYVRKLEREDAAFQRAIDKAVSEKDDLDL